MTDLSLDLQKNISRRQFLLTGAATLGSVALPGFVKRVEAATVQSYVALFAESIGCSSNPVSYDRFVSRLDLKSYTEIVRVNRMMAKAGFVSFHDSYVHGFRARNGGSYFFYPVVFRDGFNVCMPFYASHHATSNLAMVEGPTIIGMARAAQDISRQHGKEAAGRLMIPQARIQTSVGSFKDGYLQPDRYKTIEGENVINYQPEGSSKGTVSVTAIRSNPKEVILQKDYPIEFLA